MKPGDLSYSPAARAAAIVFRTAHIATMAVLVGGTLLSASHPSLPAWRHGVVITGVLLLLTEVSHSRHWVYQGRGIATLTHVGALGLWWVSASMGKTAMLLALAIGSVGSHLPKSLRKWSLRHGRVVD